MNRATLQSGHPAQRLLHAASWALCLLVAAPTPVALAAPAASAASAPSAAQAINAPRMEFAHYWISPGERASLDVIAKRFAARGGQWIDTPSPDYEFMKRDSFVRIAAGFPPGAMWLGADDVTSINALGVITPLNSWASEDGWRKFLYDFLWAEVSSKGEVVGLPLTLHNENWAWFNAKLYRRLQLPLPKTWDDVLAQAPVFARAGLLPLAISDQPWNLRLLFTTMIAGAAGPDLYRRLYTQEDPTVFDHPRVLRVLKILDRLRAYKPPPGKVKTWNAATALVIQGQAGMQVMGDWAKGEFASVGTSPQMDFVCAPVPEAERIFITAVDMLAFPRLRDAPGVAGQRLLARLVLEPGLQADFARKKGSLPVRPDVPAASLDACAAASRPRLNDASMRLASPRSATSEQARVAMQAQLAAFWNQPEMDVETLRAGLKKALHK